MAKFVANLILVIMAGYAFIWSYNNLARHINYNYKNQAKSYFEQNQIINLIQAKFPQSLTKEKLMEFDNKYGTHLASEVESPRASYMGAYRNNNTTESTEKLTVSDLLNEQLNFIKMRNDEVAKFLENNERNFWSYFPPIPTLIFGGIGIFLTALITNFSNCCYESCTALINQLNRLLKKRKNKKQIHGSILK